MSDHGCFHMRFFRGAWKVEQPRGNRIAVGHRIKARERQLAEARIAFDHLWLSLQNRGDRQSFRIKAGA